eukprot:UN07606
MGGVMHLTTLMTQITPEEFCWKEKYKEDILPIKICLIQIAKLKIIVYDKHFLTLKKMKLKIRLEYSYKTSIFELKPFFKSLHENFCVDYMNMFKVFERYA